MISSPEEFVKLRTSETSDEYNRAAHDEAPLDVWIQIIEKYPDMKKWVVHNKTVPIEILNQLVDDKDSRVSSGVADKRKIPEELQFKLATDSDSGVRGRLVCNKKTTKRVLELLSKDEWQMVRERAQQRLTDGEYR